MQAEKKIILFGAGVKGREALEILGVEKVHCFVDNKKMGQTFLEKEVISFEELEKIHSGYDIVITVSMKYASEIEEQCKAGGIRYTPFHEISYLGLPSIPEIKKFENKYKGRRCFLVGNGPSLRAADLTTLYENGEVSFGCNAISKVFDQTPWRPQYYVVQDRSYFKYFVEMLADTDAKYKFFSNLNDDFSDCDYNKNEITDMLANGKGKVIYFRDIRLSRKILRSPEAPFSLDSSKIVFVHSTVMYTMIQLAVYMGFSTIYLTGVDGTVVSMNNIDDYVSEKQHFYYDDIESVQQLARNRIFPDTDDYSLMISNAYQAADKHTRAKDVAIFNATRGGKLEIFEKADFDSLF